MSDYLDFWSAIPYLWEMKMTDNKINPKHSSIRLVLRLIGPALLVVGAIFMIVGFVDFVGAMNGHGAPTKFWCFFVGMPLLFLGFVTTNMAFLGAVMRYQAQEVAPVATDTINYMADGTQQGVKTVARAAASGIAEGLAEGSAAAASSSSAASTASVASMVAGLAAEPTASAKVILCHKCNAVNPEGSLYCNACAAPLGKTRPCTACGELNDPDARFCDNCGGVLGE